MIRASESQLQVTLPECVAVELPQQLPLMSIADSVAGKVSCTMDMTVLQEGFPRCPQGAGQGN